MGEGGGGVRARKRENKMETTGYEPFRAAHTVVAGQEGRYKATWRREFKLLWRKAGLLKLS